MAGKGKGQRHQRIEGELHRTVAELVARELKDPRVGNVTITAVRVAPDLSVARVFFLPFGAAAGAEETRHGLTHAAGFLRGEVGRRLRLRHAPRLEFVVDETIERASRLSSLIDEAVAGDRRPASGGGSDDGTA